VSRLTDPGVLFILVPLAASALYTAAHTLRRRKDRP